MLGDHQTCTELSPPDCWFAKSLSGQTRFSHNTFAWLRSVLSCATNTLLELLHPHTRLIGVWRHNWLHNTQGISISQCGLAVEPTLSSLVTCSPIKVDKCIRAQSFEGPPTHHPPLRCRELSRRTLPSQSLNNDSQSRQRRSISLIRDALPGKSPRTGLVLQGLQTNSLGVSPIRRSPPACQNAGAHEKKSVQHVTERIVYRSGLISNTPLGCPGGARPRRRRS